jgi:hypothetical protein
MELRNKLKFGILIAIVISIIIYLEFKINSNLSFHQGKDQGFFIRIESICFLSTIFYFLMTRKKRFIMTFLGFFIGLFSVIISYLICLLIIDFRYSGFIFHLLSSLIYIGNFFWIEKRVYQLS